MSKMPILEVFGPTIQGEGPAVGRKVMFIRTAGCDYSCSWCDSAFTWNGTAKDQIRMLEPAEVLAELEALDPHFDYLVVSGGNPALIKEPMEQLINLLHEEGISVAVETQGSRYQPWMSKLDEVILSPKPPSSGMVTNYDTLDEIIHTLAESTYEPKVALKIVVFNDEDFAYAKNLYLKYSGMPFYLSVGNTDVHEDGSIYHRVLHDYQKLVDKVLADSELQNIRVLPQLHTLIWGNKKGV